jgi:succinyl-CoA synthetase alpha subunit
MSVLLSENTRVIVQGITGKMGRFQCTEMLRYGTRVVGGVSPGRSGTEVAGVVVFDTVRQAVGETGGEMSIILVAASRAKDAIYEAVDAGIRVIVCVAEFVPVHDSIEIRRRLHGTGVRLIGPNCSGLISPGKAKAGFYCDEVCMPGDIGVMSKSGTLSYATLLELKRKGLGASTVIGVGGDEVKGTSFADCVGLFEGDPDTGAILIIGEIGGRDEELAAEYIRTNGTKPTVAFIAGRTIPAGKNVGHAGAIVVGNKGAYASKVEAFKAAGVPVAETIEEIPTLLSNARKSRQRG